MTSLLAWNPPLHAATARSRRTRRLQLLGPERTFTPGVYALVGTIALLLTGIASTRGLLAGVGAIAGIALGIAVLRFPPVGAYVLAFAVPVLSGVKRGVPVPGLRLSEVLVVGMALLVIFPARRTALQRWGMVDWLAFAYAVASIVVPTTLLVLRGVHPTTTAISSLFLPLQFFLLFRVVKVALPDAVMQRFAMRTLLLGSLFVGAVAALQELNLGPSRRLVQQFTDSEALASTSYAAYARATGPFQHWHPLAGYLTVIVLLTVALLLERDESFMSRRLLSVVLGVNVVALMLSVTFTSMIGIVLGTAYLGYRAGKTKQVLQFSAIAVVVLGVIFSSFLVTRIHNQYVDASGAAQQSLIPQTIGTRLNVWQDQYLPGLAGHWAIGYGPDLPPVVQWTHTESLYVTLILRGGLPMLALFSALLIALSVTAGRIGREHVGRRASTDALVAVIAVSWIMNLLYPYLTSSGMPQPFWVLAGIVTAGLPISRRSTGRGAVSETDVSSTREAGQMRLQETR